MTLDQYLLGLSHSTNLKENPKEVEITALTSDSRQIRPGCLFVCIKGGKFDGHTAAPQALAEGAAAVVTERDLGLERQILVENTRSAYALLCAAHFGHPSRRLKLIGVTGTNGKTTVTYLLKSILASCGKKTGLLGTIHNEILDMVLPAKYTTPDPYQLHAMLARMVEAGCEYVVMETSSHALDQHRLDGCVFEAGIFTNLTQDHLDYHGTMENYFQAKAKLFGLTKRAVVNGDDSYGRRLRESLGEGCVTWSLEGKEADYAAREITFGADGSRFLLTGKGGLSLPVTIPMPGRFSVSNAMAAAATAMELGFAPEDVAKGLASCTGVTGRAEVIPTGRNFTVIRDYAHTPDGLEKITSTLREFATGRIMTLFGCAGNRDRTKRPDMVRCAARYSDFIVLTSDNPRDEDPIQIIEDAKPGFDKCDTPYIIIPDRYTALLWALEHIQPGDILLLAGKGHEDYQVLHDETIYFDEKVLVEQLLAEMPEK